MTRAEAKRRARVGTARVRHMVAGLLALVTAMTVSACATDDDRPSIVVTTNIIGDVTREIVGDEADVTVLMKPNADPHSFGLSAVQAAELEQADLVVYNGLGVLITSVVDTRRVLNMAKTSGVVGAV
ncbi:Periplasmic solute binding protein Precursor [Streptomyces microflavus DSM 40593]|uniref:Periplasmic solute binding protein n=1 Tax=Streptomyces microflavus DSM 40593 TaxID=1303692 RepID=N0D0I7_STRMI|nr:Periplasmic solute binding protein Precursor [Streptomyces microflavus DSM 40593]